MAEEDDAPQPPPHTIGEPYEIATTRYAAQLSAYPVMAYNFRVTVDGQSAAFSEVSGLNREWEHVTYRHGLSYAEGEVISKHRLDKYVSVTFKRGVVRSITLLHSWIETKDKRPVEIHLCDEQGNAVIAWKIEKALPVKLEAPTFDASSNEVAVESLEVMAAGISVKDL